MPDFVAKMHQTQSQTRRTGRTLWNPSGLLAGFVKGQEQAFI